MAAAPASAMPREGTLISESTASRLTSAILKLEGTVGKLVHAISNPKDGLSLRLHQQTLKLDSVYDPEAAILARAAVFNSIDATIAKIKSELAGVSPAAPAPPPAEST